MWCSVAVPNASRPVVGGPETMTPWPAPVFRRFAMRRIRVSLMMRLIGGVLMVVPVLR